MPEMSNRVRGVGLDEQTRCAHYHSPLDVIAIRMKCCDTYFACKDCHEELADHAIEVWPRAEWGKKAILCGACETELTIESYMAGDNRCPACGAEFNPGCRKHYRFYFEMTG
jgi:uncharacterized CHY-type Zn-finger protein